LNLKLREVEIAPCVAVPSTECSHSSQGMSNCNTVSEGGQRTVGRVRIPESNSTNKAQVLNFKSPKSPIREYPIWRLWSVDLSYTLTSLFALRVYEWQKCNYVTFPLSAMGNFQIPFSRAKMACCKVSHSLFWYLGINAASAVLRRLSFYITVSYRVWIRK
jgi:hypothetical protein